MAIMRVAALKDFRTTAVTTCGPGTVYDLTSLTSTQKLVGFLHLTCTSTGRTFTARLQSASSSSFIGVTTTAFAFGLTTAIGSTWPAPVTISTAQHFFRAYFGMSTAASTAGGWKGLMGMGVQ